MFENDHQIYNTSVNCEDDEEDNDNIKEGIA